MTLFDYLKLVVEHKKSPIYQGGDIPLYIVNRFISFISDPQCKVINEMLNYDHWQTQDKELRLKLLQTLVPKVKYSYPKLFGGYVKSPNKSKNSDEKELEYLSKVFDVSKKEAEGYLKEKGVREFLDTVEL